MKKTNTWKKKPLKQALKDAGLSKKEFKWEDFEFKISQEHKALFTFFDKWLVKNYGKRCKMKAQKCSTCEAWALRDFLNIFI